MFNLRLSSQRENDMLLYFSVSVTLCTSKITLLRENGLTIDLQGWWIRADFNDKMFRIEACHPVIVTITCKIRQSFEYQTKM